MEYPATDVSTLRRPTPQESPPFFGTPHSRLVELQVMNHYTYMHTGHASDHHPALRLMWSYTVPQAALGSELLMDAVLAQGAQHLHPSPPFSSYSSMYVRTASESGHVVL